MKSQWHFSIRDWIWLTAVIGLSLLLAHYNYKLSMERFARSRAELEARTMRLTFESLGFEFIEGDGHIRVQRSEEELRSFN